MAYVYELEVRVIEYCKVPVEADSAEEAKLLFEEAPGDYLGVRENVDWDFAIDGCAGRRLTEEEEARDGN